MTSIRNVSKRVTHLAIFLILAALLLQRSVLDPSEVVEKVRAYTREIEFDYVNWTLDALGVKLDQISLGAVDYLPEASQHQVVLDYLDLVGQIQQGEAQLEAYYADPNILDPERASQLLRAELDKLYTRREQLAPLAESILQNQLSTTLSDLDLTLGGQPIPPALYHVTPLPMALIVSPRDIIRQDADISLVPDLTIDQIVALEEEVDRGLDVSSLVVNIGGVGLYPTMVMQTTNLNWMVETIAHEWTHNFLTLRPLGANYFTSPELRTMNETTASISGNEIGVAMIQRYYPEFAPPPPPPSQEEEEAQPPVPAEPEPLAFDFRAEMHETRVTADELLAEGKIEEAETYMEERRIVFWEQGYRIRKLNQAYFAFYGAYADQPGGAAGKDPVGAAVRDLRAQSASLAAFLNKISWMWSYEQLKTAVNQAQE
jgi:hypothetical protein